MIKNLLDIAAELDRNGLTKEADIVDLIIRKVAAEFDDQDYFGEETDNIPTEEISEEELNEALSGSSVEEHLDMMSDAPEEGDPSNEEIEEMFRAWQRRQERA